MKYTETRLGRVFVIRLENGDILHECVETFAATRGVRAGALLAVGGVDGGSRLVVGPEDGEARPVVPMEQVLTAAHEAAGVGTLFPDEDGTPILHMHAACGRENQTVTGCARRGVRVWQVLELILIELADTGSIRKMDPATGFKLLEPEG
ncbi:MAG: DNA-binding protein [Lentisphaeria bacterium]|nr:DNA-binding protein [Lentisphaeria bacterium]